MFCCSLQFSGMIPSCHYGGRSMKFPKAPDTASFERATCLGWFLFFDPAVAGRVRLDRAWEQ